MRTHFIASDRTNSQSRPPQQPTSSLKPRPFNNPVEEATVQAEQNTTPDLQTQLEHGSKSDNLLSRVPILQPKLSVGEPNDQYEQEADRVASQVMSMAAPPQQPNIQRQTAIEEEELQTKPLASTITPLIQREAMPEEKEEPLQAKAIQREAIPEEEEPLQAKLIQREAIPEEEEEPIQAKLIQREAMPEEEEPLQAKLIQREAIPEEEEEPIQAKLIQREAMPEEEELQRKPSLQRAIDGNLQTGKSLEDRLSSSKGGGVPLPEDVRSFMEPRFSADFSQVRVHTGSDAVQMSRELGAQAFTHGSHIFYGSGKAPAKDELTGHELTHVLQQTGIGQSQLKQNHLGETAQKKVSTIARKTTPNWVNENQQTEQNKNERSSSLWSKQPQSNNSQHQPVSQAMGWGLIQRQDAKKDAEDAKKLQQAEEDLGKFSSKSYKYNNFSIQGGKFDVVYQPTANLLNVNMKIQFKFLNDTSDTSTLAMHWLRSLFSDANADAYAAAVGMWTTKDMTDYRKLFHTQVMKAWNDRYTFSNVREPQSVWKKLNPVHVKLNLMEVDASPHFLIQVHKKAGRAQVWKGITDLHPGNEKTQSPFLHKQATKGELDRLSKINPGPILFENNSAKINSKYNPDLQFMATYLSRINEPKFDIAITGHASATGKAPHNLKLSEARAREVETMLKTGGAINHNLNINWVGQTGSTADPMWRKVDIVPAISAGFTNSFDTIPHEFGHMIGLGDEYKDKGGAPLASHHDLVTKAFGKKYADLVAVRGSAPATVGTGSNIMNVGKDVRIYDYVTFWSALCETTLKAPVPTPPFGYGDWKFNG